MRAPALCLPMLAAALLGGGTAAANPLVPGSIDHSCVATEAVRQQVGLQSLPPAMGEALAAPAEAFRSDIDAVFETSAAAETERLALAWRHVETLLADDPALRERLTLAARESDPGLAERYFANTASAAERVAFERLFQEHVSVDPEILRRLRLRLSADANYDALLARGLEIGGRLDELEGRQIAFNADIPAHWPEQDQQALVAARRFAETQGYGGARLVGVEQNHTIRQAVALLAMVKSEAGAASSPSNDRLWTDTVHVEGRPVGLPLPEVREALRGILEVRRRGELRLSHMDEAKLGDAPERAAIFRGGGWPSTAAVASRQVGLGVQDLLLADVARRRLAAVEVPPPPELPPAAEPAAAERRATEYIGALSAPLGPSAEQVLKIVGYEMKKK